MPIHCPSLHRRSFLQTLAAGGVVVCGMRTPLLADAVDGVDANYFALLSDTHIPNHPDVTARGVNMTENLRRVVRRLRELSPKPANLIINGDCAYLKGLPEDYQNLAETLAPIDASETALHLLMGNHDNRGPLFAEFEKQRPSLPPVESKHLAVIESEHANWFLLDSLFQVNVVTGQLGSSQLDWLGQLDQHDDKPAIVMVHHNPQFEAPAANQPWSGIEDTTALFDVLHQRKHVKVVIFGHTHTWKEFQHGSIRLINLPPVAYVFSEGQPNGWVSAKLSAEGLHLQLHTHDPAHPQSEQVVQVSWS